MIQLSIIAFPVGTCFYSSSLFYAHSTHEHLNITLD